MSTRRLTPPLSSSEPLTVLMTADTVGEVWTFARELAQALYQYGGLRIILATTGRRMSPDQRLAAQAIPGLVICEGTYQIEGIADTGDEMARLGDWLLGLERRYRPHLIHLNGTFALGTLPWKAPVLITAHSCAFTRRSSLGEEPLPAEEQYRQAAACGLHAADFVVAPTQAMRESLCATYGTLGRSTVVYNGRDPARFRRRIARGNFVLAAGHRDDEAKNLEALLEVAPKLPCSVFLAGEENAQDARHPHPRNVRLLGSQDAGAMAALMTRAAIYALPARYEPFGLSALGAGMAGCALVLGDIPSLREVWGEAALFVPPGNSAALTRAIRTLACCEKTRRRYEEQAQERAQQLTAQQMARSYLSIYRNLIAVRHGEGEGQMTRDPLASLPSLPHPAAFATATNPQPVPSGAPRWRFCSAWSEGMGEENAGR